MFKGITTPLASIFGSGFLVIVAVLNGILGPFAILGMVAICLLAYAVGTAIRFNIEFAEPIVAGKSKSTIVKMTDRIADIALVPAYIISITLYLRILSSYSLGIANIHSELWERGITTAILLLILTIGLIKGLRILEGLEKWALSITLLIVAVLITTFLFRDISILNSGTLVLSNLPDMSAWKIITVLGGTLIVVQGFETTRYLGEEYDAKTRIKASRNSQLISSTVYCVFIIVALPLTHILRDEVTDNALIELSKEAVFWLAYPVVFAAIFSQFSAATADTIGASGNIREFTNKAIPTKLTYVFICGLAIILTWSTDTLQILALASRTFAFYYFLQCIISFFIASSLLHKTWFLFIAAIMLFITIFAVPVG